MSLEEKAKYTNRAREVWDNYLSTAPARTPKPRKQVKYIYCNGFLIYDFASGEFYSFYNAD